MQTWIDWLSRQVGGLLFQGGYVTAPTILVVARPALAAGDVRREPAVREDSPGRPTSPAPAGEVGIVTAAAPAAAPRC